MSVYHFENGQLEALDMSIEALIPSDSSEQRAWHRVGFDPVEDNEGAYALYQRFVPPSSDDGVIAGYEFAFTVEGGNDLVRWVLLVRNDLQEYLEAMRLLQPLLTRVAYLEIEAENTRRLARESPAQFKAPR